MAEDLEQIKNLVIGLFAALGVEAEIAVAQDKETASVMVQIESLKKGLLIGRNGETINSLQLILNLMVFRKLNRPVRIIVNVADYRQKRKEYLVEMAQEAAKQVLETKEGVVLPELSSFERRIIHLELADNPNVESLSEGEGKDRRLVVRPKESQTDSGKN